MQLVTGKWKRRDGKPLIAVYDDGGSFLYQILPHGLCQHYRDGRKSATGIDKNDLLPVPREPVYRPFRDLAEAFSVMGPAHWIRHKPENELFTWFAPCWNPAKEHIQGNDMDGLMEFYEWTSDPSSATGRVCGVEVTE